MECFTLQIRYKPNWCVIVDLWHGVYADQRHLFVTWKKRESLAIAACYTCLSNDFYLLVTFINSLVVSLFIGSTFPNN